MESKVHKIFLPDDEQMGQMIEGAWKQFVNDGREAGYDLSENIANGWLKDAFVGGWVSGWNDGYGLIRGQLEAINFEHET